MTDVALHYRTCTLCEAMCGLEIGHVGEAGGVGPR